MNQARAADFSLVTHAFNCHLWLWG